MFGEVDLGGAGRTDAGVHAAGQVAHLRMHKAADPRLIGQKINDLLPHDISIVDVQRMSDRFHARHDATSRVYLYQIATRRTAFAKPFVWWIKDRLDGDAIPEAAATIAGRHDFSAFTDKRLAAGDSRIVVVERCEAAQAGDLILIRIEASHFLWKMVRRLTGTLLEVGRGRLDAAGVRALLESRSGKPAEWTAPPSGLFLESVAYPGDSPPPAIDPYRPGF